MCTFFGTLCIYDIVGNIKGNIKPLYVEFYIEVFTDESNGPPEKTVEERQAKQDWQTFIICWIGVKGTWEYILLFSMLLCMFANFYR